MPAGYLLIQFNSDTFCLERVSDPTGQRLPTARLLPLQMPVKSTGCAVSVDRLPQAPPWIKFICQIGFQDSGKYITYVYPFAIKYIAKDTDKL